MPPELLRFVARTGSEGEARKDAERLASAVAGDARGVVFFAGSALLVAVDDDWPPRAFERADVKKPLYGVYAATVSDPAHLEAHRLPCLASWGRFEGRGVALRTAARAEEARLVVDALAGVPEATLRDLGIEGWAAFGRRTDLVLVFRGGERLAEGVRALVTRRPKWMPRTDPRHQGTVFPPWIGDEEAPDGPEARLRNVLDEATGFEPSLPAAGLFPDLLHLDDARALGAWGPRATEALPGAV